MRHFVYYTLAVNVDAMVWRSLRLSRSFLESKRAYCMVICRKAWQNLWDSIGVPSTRRPSVTSTATGILFLLVEYCCMACCSSFPVIVFPRLVLVSGFWTVELSLVLVKYCCMLYGLL